MGERLLPAGRISLEAFLEELVFGGLRKQDKFHENGMWAGAFRVEVKLSRSAEVEKRLP